MRKFPIFSSINPSLLSEDSREGNMHLLRNTILQSDDLLKYHDWTKKSFLKSLGRGKIQFKKKFFCILCLSIYYESNDVFVYVTSSEKLLLNEVIESVCNSEYPLTLVFLYCEESQKSNIDEKLRLLNHSKICIFLSSNDNRRFLFALSCEIVNWWELASCRYENVDFSNIHYCVKKIVENYLLYTGIDMFDVTIIDLFTSTNQVAWHQGTNYCPDTDIEKIGGEARIEQVADVIKRIFDNANYPREEYMTPKDRLKSSQGLFWLAEICDYNDVKNWILDTRFYKEISIETNISIPTVNLKVKEQIDLTYYEQLLSDFIKIPSGKYTFGTTIQNADSEPPANEFTLVLDEFSILKYPVTNYIWGQVIEEKVNDSDLPKVNINYFEALYFVESLNKLFENFFPEIAKKIQFNIPSEYQWEAAARGIEGFNYPWGNSFDQSKCNCEMILGKPSSTGFFSPNGDTTLGCQDMSGNVRELTRTYGGTKGVDWKFHSIENYLKNTLIVPSSRLIIKGGSYSYSHDCVTGWMRNTQIASRKDLQTGFRLVLEKLII